MFYRLVLLHSICAILLSVSFFSAANTSPTTNSEPYVEPTSGEMEFITDNNGSEKIQHGIQLNSKAHIAISGIMAVVEMEQHFQNPSDQWREGRYVFPLPDNAAINKMEIHIGERRITANIKEKQEARQIYDTAKATGKKTALLEQHRPNLFSQNIANIGPKEKVIVKLRYSQTIGYRDGEFSLRFPMTITPRYIPTSSFINDVKSISPPISDKHHHFISLTVDLDAGLPLANIDSDYHSIAIIKKESQHRITFPQDKIPMDRDFVLRWKTLEKNVPQATFFNESIDGDDYKLIMLVPPKSSTQAEKINTETLFIIDTSGSMGGSAIQQAKTSLAYALKRLDPQDTFNIIQFNSTYSLLYQKPQIANRSNIYHALSYVGYLRASGGTEMLPALDAAFSQEHESERLKQIVFITDGSVSNESALFELIHQKIGNARLFTVGIGSAPNSYFMRKAAEFGKGTFTHIGNINDVSKNMRALFNKITQPTMRDITIEDSQGRKIEVFPKPLPDLYFGEPLFAAVKADYELDSLTIKGIHNHQHWQQTLAFNHGKNNKGIATVWARKKIESLLDKERTEGKQASIKNAVIELAIQHQLLSPYTSFVAVEEQPSRPMDSALHKEAIPNMLAAGQVLQSVHYPQTATALWLHILLGLSTLIASVVLRLCK